MTESLVGNLEWATAISLDSSIDTSASGTCVYFASFFEDSLADLCFPQIIYIRATQLSKEGTALFFVEQYGGAILYLISVFNFLQL